MKTYQEKEAADNKKRVAPKLENRSSVQMSSQKSPISKKEIDAAICELNPDESSRDRG